MLCELTWGERDKVHFERARWGYDMTRTDGFLDDFEIPWYSSFRGDGGTSDLYILPHQPEPMAFNFFFVFVDVLCGRGRGCYVRYTSCFLVFFMLWSMACLSYWKRKRGFLLWGEGDGNNEENGERDVRRMGEGKRLEGGWEEMYHIRERRGRGRDHMHGMVGKMGVGAW